MSFNKIWYKYILVRWFIECEVYLEQQPKQMQDVALYQYYAKISISMTEPWGENKMFSRCQIILRNQQALKHSFDPHFNRLAQYAFQINWVT